MNLLGVHSGVDPNVWTGRTFPHPVYAFGSTQNEAGQAFALCVWLAKYESELAIILAPFKRYSRWEILPFEKERLIRRPPCGQLGRRDARHVE